MAAWLSGTNIVKCPVLSESDPMEEEGLQLAVATGSLYQDGGATWVTWRPVVSLEV